MSVHLTGEMIDYCLSQEISCNYLGLKNLIIDKPPLFFDEDIDPSGHVVLLTDNTTVQVVGRYAEALFVVSAEQQEHIINQYNNILFVEENTPVQVIYNHLIRIYMKFETWEIAMQQIVENFSTFQKLIDTCYMVLENPIALTDAQFRYIAYSQPAQINDYIKKYVDNNQSVPLDLAQESMILPTFKKLQEIKDVYRFVNQEESFLQLNLFYKEVFIGRLALAYTEDGKKNDFFSSMLLIIANYVEALYSRYGSFQRPSNTKLIKQAIHQKLNKKTEISGNLRELLIKNGHAQNTIYSVVQIRAHFSRNNLDYTDYICAQLENRWVGTYCISLDDKIIILIDTNFYQANTHNNFYQELVLFLRESILIAATSRPFNSPDDIDAAYRQTDIAFTLGRETQPSYWYYRFDDYALKYLLKNGFNQFKPDQICHPALVVLRRYDTKKQTQYFRTLREFFKQQFNASQSAKALGLARSSFLNRLDRIESITHMDLQSWDEQIYLTLSFGIYERTIILDD